MLASLFPTTTRAAAKVIAGDDFEHGLKSSWKKVEFESETVYTIEKEGTNSYLKAVAKHSASGLATKLDAVDPRNASFSWKWKIDHVPPGGSDTEKKSFDHAARMFVAFKTFIGPPKTINYVWANEAKVGGTFHHPSSGRSRFIVLRSGNGEAGKWFSEKRNLANDWKRLFGDDEPPAIVGIGFMTDSDGTKSTVVGCYDDIALTR
jgi:hypothetical protein